MHGLAIKSGALALALALLAGLQIARAVPHDHAESGALFDELAAMDQRLFEVAFVSCDAEAFGALRKTVSPQPERGLPQELCPQCEQL